MAKKKKKNPADLTLRNLKAEKDRIREIRKVLKELTRRVKKLEKACL